MGHDLIDVCMLHCSICEKFMNLRLCVIDGIACFGFGFGCFKYAIVCTFNVNRIAIISSNRGRQDNLIHSGGANCGAPSHQIRCQGNQSNYKTLKRIHLIIRSFDYFSHTHTYYNVDGN